METGKKQKVTKLKKICRVSDGSLQTMREHGDIGTKQEKTISKLQGF